jgi:hypothetical protein
MMQYENIRTGNRIHTECQITGEDWREIKPASLPKQNADSEETQKAKTSGTGTKKRTPAKTTKTRGSARAVKK